MSGKPGNFNAGYYRCTHGIGGGRCGRPAKWTRKRYRCRSHWPVG